MHCLVLLLVHLLASFFWAIVSDARVYLLCCSCRAPRWFLFPAPAGCLRSVCACARACTHACFFFHAGVLFVPIPPRASVRFLGDSHPSSPFMFGHFLTHSGLVGVSFMSTPDCHSLATVSGTLAQLAHCTRCNAFTPFYHLPHGAHTLCVCTLHTSALVRLVSLAISAFVL